MHKKMASDRFRSLNFAIMNVLVIESNSTCPLAGDGIMHARLYSNLDSTKNVLTCVIHDLIDGPCTGGMNADDAVCNLKRSNPCCGGSYRSSHERALLNDKTPAASNRASMSMALITRAVPNILFNTNLPFTAIHTAG